MTNNILLVWKNDEKNLQRFGDKGKAFEKGEIGSTAAGWQVSCVELTDRPFVCCQCFGVAIVLKTIQLQIIENYEEGEL